MVRKAINWKGGIAETTLSDGDDVVEFDGPFKYILIPIDTNKTPPTTIVHFHPRRSANRSKAGVQFGSWVRTSTCDCTFWQMVMMTMMILDFGRAQLK